MSFLVRDVVRNNELTILKNGKRATFQLLPLCCFPCLYFLANYGTWAVSILQQSFGMTVYLKSTFFREWILAIPLLQWMHLFCKWLSLFKCTPPWKLCGLFHSAQDIPILSSLELEIKHFISPQVISNRNSHTINQPIELLIMSVLLCTVDKPWIG